MQDICCKNCNVGLKKSANKRKKAGMANLKKRERDRINKVCKTDSTKNLYAVLPYHQGPYYKEGIRGKLCFTLIGSKF